MSHPMQAYEIEAHFTEPEPEKPKNFGVIEKIGVGALVLIAIGTGVAVTAAIRHDKEVAERPKVELQLPPGYRVIDMPPGQIDVVTFCDGPNRVYRDAGGSKGEAISVSPNDPTCKE